MTTDRDYVMIAVQYARGVIKGETLACIYVIQACKRFIADLKRKDLEMRAKKARRICMFIEKLKHVKGKWARTNIILEPWQIFILVNVFGFYWKGTNKRRFRQVYAEIPRKNAKSTLTSGVGLFGTALDGEIGAEVYSAATTRDQARIVFKDAQKMLRNNQEVREKTGLELSAHAVVHEESESSFKALSADANTLDGLSVYFGLIDEFHAHKTADIIDVIETATGARENPLIWIITTAGADIGRPCYEKRDFAINVLAKRIEDESSDAQFAIIYTIDKGDDWKTEEAWKKANPNYGVSVNPDDIRIKAKAAQQSPVKRAAFMTKHLNVWVNSMDSWMSPESWSACGGWKPDEHDFDENYVWLGVDLASRRDIVAIQLIIKRGGEWYTFGRYYVPSERLEDDGNSEYRSWAETGDLIAMEGNTVDFERIKSDIVGFCGQYDVRGVAYDPFQAAKLVNELNELDIPTVEVRQTYLSLSEPMKEMENLISDGKIKHDSNKCMEWMMANVVAKRDDKDNIRPVKETYKKKIDGPVAMIMAMALAHREVVQGSIYDERQSLFA